MFDALSAELLEQRLPSKTRPTASARVTGAVTDWDAVVGRINDNVAAGLSGISRCSTIMLERGSHNTIYAWFGMWQGTLGGWASSPAKALEQTVAAAAEATVTDASGQSHSMSLERCDLSSAHPAVDGLYWPSIVALAQTQHPLRWSHSAAEALATAEARPAEALSASAQLLEVLTGLPRAGHGLPVARPADITSFFQRFEPAAPQAPDGRTRAADAATTSGSTCVDTARILLGAHEVPIRRAEATRFLTELVSSGATNLVNWRESHPHKPLAPTVSVRAGATAAAHAAQRLGRQVHPPESSEAAAAPVSAAATAAADLIPYAHEAVLHPDPKAFPSLAAALQQGLLAERLPSEQFRELARRAGVVPRAARERRGRPVDASPPGLSPLQIQLPTFPAAAPVASASAAAVAASAGVERVEMQLQVMSYDTDMDSAAANAAGDDQSAAAGAPEAQPRTGSQSSRKRRSSAAVRADELQARVEFLPPSQRDDAAVTRRSSRSTAGINNSAATKDYL